MGWYLDLDIIMQDQDDIRLAAYIPEGFLCQSAGWAAGYAKIVKLLVRCNRATET